MKKIFKLFIPFLLLIYIGACTDKPTIVESDAPAEISDLSQALSAGQIAAREHIMKKSRELGIEFDNTLTKSGPESVSALLTYEAELCGDPTAGEVIGGSISNSVFWKYYRFSGNAGDLVDITVNRVADGKDLAFVLYSGIGTTTDGLTTTTGNSELTWLMFRDDNIYFVPWYCFGDPQILGYALPSTGEYTLAVLEWGCGNNPGFEIVTNGISCVVPLMDQKAAVVAELQALLTGDEKTDKEINKAIEKIQKSLDPEKWIDGDHLDPKHGKKVFDEEEKAVKELKKIAKDKKSDPLLVDAVTVIIETLVAIDEQLALTALTDIEGLCVTDKCEKELEKVYKELGKAAEEIAKGHMDHAIDKYKKAWEHTQHAIKHNAP